MGKELPLARQEEEGQSVLLASTRLRELVSTPSSRNKRKKEPNAPEAYDGGEAEGAKAKSKSSRKAKRADVSTARPKGHRRDNQDRKSDRGDEGEGSKPRRTAQELGVTHPGSHCDDDSPHRWKEISKECGGVLLKCKHCYKHIWLPSQYGDAEKLGNLIKLFGSNEGYCLYLNRRREAKILMAKMQRLENLSVEITDKVEFAKLTDKILSEKDYDKKEVSDD